MFSPAEPTTAPQHSPHGEQDSAVLETQEAQEEQSLTLGVEQQVTEAPQVEAGLAVDAMSAAPAEVTPMMAASPAMAPMEGNPVGEEEAGVAKEQEVQTQEFSSGDGSAPPADEAGAASTPPGGGTSGGGPGEENAATEVSALEDDVEGESADGPATEAEAPAGPVHTTPRCPEDDPEFQATVARKDSTVAEQQQHEEPIAAAGAAQASSVSPANERESMAEAGQVNEMEQEEPGVFDAASFKAMLMEAIAAILPKNNEEADDFADSGKVDEVKSKATSKVESEKESAAGNIEQKAKEAPDTNSVPVREVQPLAPQDAGPPPVNIEASKAMPPKRGDSEVNAPLDQNVAEMDQTMTDAQVTEEQLANSNEPAFTGALSSKNEAKQHAQEAPVQFRQQEQATLATSEANAQATGEAQLTAMHQDRAGAMGQVSAGQQQTASKDTSARQKVSDRINGLYEQTKTDVETILNNLDTSVKTMFDAASSKATKAFEKLVDKRMSAYKSKRYSGLIGKGRWIKDLFAGLPDEVNAFFTEGRNLYLDIMDGELTAISEHVATELTAAKDRIKKGKQDIQDYVVSLPKDLQQVGKEAADEINSKFDELTESVNSKGEELVDTIADMYKESLDKVDARIEEMKAANRGLIDMALGALMGVIKTILMIKDMLFNLLAAALEALGAIISDPIGFLSNLVEGVKQGIQNFFSNILGNVMTGLIEWLTGSLGDVGIQMPDNLFSLSGIFSLVTQMLGLTWDYFRDKAVKMLGEPVVSAMETGLELFQIIRKDGVQGLWDHIKEQFTDLKEMVMDAIRDMIVTKVIEAGIKWILGLLSPAGAFIKAAMLIIDIVKFFVERAAQIFELVNAFIEGIKALASGNVGAVAKAIEKALVKAIPILIGFLAALVGVTGLTSKVQKIIKKVRKRIDKAIRKIIKKAKRLFKGKKKGKKVTNKDLKDDDKKSDSEREHDDKVEKGLKYLRQLEKKNDDDKNKALTEEQVFEVAENTKKKHRIFKSITPKKKGGKWVYHWRASQGEENSVYTVDETDPVQVRIQKAYSVPLFQSNFDSNDWKTHFKGEISSISQAKKDIKWGRQNGRIFPDMSVSLRGQRGKHYSLEKMNDDQLVAISEKQIKVAGKNHRQFAKDYITWEDVQAFSINNERLPNAIGQFPQKLCERILRELSIKEVLMEIDTGKYTFKSMQPERELPGKWKRKAADNVRWKFYFNGTTYATEKEEIATEGLKRIRRIINFIESADAVERQTGHDQWADLVAEKIVVDSVYSKAKKKKYLTRKEYEVDHEPSIAKHWNKGGNNSKWNVRQAHATANLELVHHSENEKKSGQGFTFLNRWWVGPDFTGPGSSKGPEWADQVDKFENM